LKWRRTRGIIGIVGVSDKYPDIRDHKLASGRFFTGLHVKQRSQVAVIGYKLAIDLLNGRNIVGSTLTLNGQSYIIIGVMTEKGVGNAEDIDNKILVPYTSAMKLANKRTVDEIWGKAASATDAELAVVQLGRIFKGKLGLTSTARDIARIAGAENQAGSEGSNTGVSGGGEAVQAPSGEDPGQNPQPEVPETAEGSEDLVTITNLNQLVKEVDNANRVMTLLLGGIAAVSLLVGGLGIMNIMMVAVHERTEEIGVRRAMGAKQSNLLLQFLLEALYISVIGSALGIIAGIWGLNIFEDIGFNTQISYQAIKIASIVALGSGLLFGVYPAISASSVPPVEALRGQ
jgi:putative ABC transport system permease protein